MAQRQAAPTPGREDRFDALLEERFSPAHRGAMARQLADHDRRATPGTQTPVLGVRPVRFHGAVPEPVQKILTQWVPELIARAAGHGLVVRDLSLEIHAFARAAYEQAHGALAAGFKLPASSYKFAAVYRLYTIHLVLPDEMPGMDAMFTVVRALLARLFGDIYLREEIFDLEAYREDVEGPAAEVTVGMAEKLVLLGALPHTSPELDAALAAYGQEIGMSAKRQPGPVRKAWFQHLRKRLEDGPLPDAPAAIVDGVFQGYAAALRKNVPAAVRAMVETVEKLNGQTVFLPPDETPEYQKLRSEQPVHYLRAAKLRLQQVLEAMGAVVEIAEALERNPAALTPLETERVHGHLTELEREHLARPYLLKGVRLSPEMERKRADFPLEVHAIMTQLPPQADATARFKSLTNRIENSAWQRLYHAFLLLKQGIQLREQGKPFADTSHFSALKGLAANFRFRRPLLEGLFAQVGVVLDLAEAASAAEAKGKARFPADVFTRGWGQFVAHTLLVDHAIARRQGGFDPARYWGVVEGTLRKQAARGPPGAAARLVLLLLTLERRIGANGLQGLVALLRSPSGTFRFTMRQAVDAPPGDPAPAIERWADAILRVRDTSLRNAIVVGTSA